MKEKSTFDLVATTLYEIFLVIAFIYAIVNKEMQLLAISTFGLLNVEIRAAKEDIIAAIEEKK